MGSGGQTQTRRTVAPLYVCGGGFWVNRDQVSWRLSPPSQVPCLHGKFDQLCQNTLTILGEKNPGMYRDNHLDRQTGHLFERLASQTPWKRGVSAGTKLLARLAFQTL